MCVLVRFHTNEGIRSGLLLSAGHKYLHILPMDYPLQVHRVPLTEGKYMRVSPAAIEPAMKKFRHAAKQWHGGLKNLSAEIQDALRKEKKVKS